MKKMMLFVVALLTSFCAFSQSIWDAKSIQEVDKIAKAKNITDANYIACVKDFFGKDISKMTYEEAKSIFVKNYKKNEEGTSAFLGCVLHHIKFKHFRKEALTKDANNYVVKYYFPLKGKQIYGTNQNYVKALMQSFKFFCKKNNISSVKLLLKKFEQIEDELKADEIKETFKLMKRQIYPKINQGDEWKQFAVQIELKLKSLE